MEVSLGQMMNISQELEEMIKAARTTEDTSTKASKLIKEEIAVASANNRLTLANTRMQIINSMVGDTQNQKLEKLLTTNLTTEEIEYSNSEKKKIMGSINLLNLHTPLNSPLNLSTPLHIAFSNKTEELYSSLKFIQAMNRTIVDGKDITGIMKSIATNMEDNIKSIIPTYQKAFKEIYKSAYQEIDTSKSTDAITAEIDQTEKNIKETKNSIPDFQDSFVRSPSANEDPGYKEVRKLQAKLTALKADKSEMELKQSATALIEMIKVDLTALEIGGNINQTGLNVLREIQAKDTKPLTATEEARAQESATKNMEIK